MIDGLQPYPEMKDSGVPWLGAVPKHWSIAALRHRYSQCLGKMLDAKRFRGDHPVSYLRNVDVQWDRINTIDLPVMDIVLSEYDRYLVQPGDLLVCEGGEVGRAAIWYGALETCGFQKALHRLRPFSPTSDSPRFMMFVLLVASAGGAFADGQESTIAHLTGEKLRAHRFPFPSGTEQFSIVRFLDHTERLFWRYIGAKRQLIVRLNEQKQVMVHHAVTRGLDPNVRLKPSGVEWLRNVPEHWEMRRLKSIFREVDDRSDTGIEVLLSLRMHRGLVPHTDVSNIPITSDALVGFRRCRPGQLVMNRMRAAIGIFAIARQAGLVSPDYAVFELREPVNEKFVLYLLKTRAMGTVFRSESKGLGTGSSGFMRLYSDRFGIIKVALPPLFEQEAIVQHLETALADLNRGIDRAHHEIELLREYRTRLITEVVTGKLDVRAAAAALPEIVGEPKGIDAALDTDDEGELEDAGDAEVEDAA